MNISICITVLNEEGTIAKLLDSLLSQSKKADEIIVVDGGSKDKTAEIIRHYQRRDGRIKLLTEHCSRAKGRNLGVEIAKSEIIVMTDAGCVADRDWLKNITKPFETKRVDVVAGFYKMTGNTPLQKAESIFLGITPRKFNNSYLPSTRSIAFTKKVWTEVGGFPERAEGAAEDTIFNYKLIKSGAKISRVKDSIVGWGMPSSLEDFFSKIFNYSKGDIKSKIWSFPGKGLMSHNIKSLFILLRYVIGLLLLIFSFKYHTLLPLLIILFLAYFYWAFRKIYLEFGERKTSLWGPALQIASDFAVMAGFISGIIGG
jgi:glycosyltransferase involved in cell wall biosynthesis